MSQPRSVTVPLGRRDVRVLFAGILLVTFLASLEQTIVAPALPLIARDLGDVARLPWVAAAYLLAATAVTPLFGKASDTYGRRPAMLVAIGIFVAGAVGCALAPTMPVLIAARTLQGAGGGALGSLAHVVIGDIVAPRERGRYQIWLAGVLAVASLTGPLLGGFLAQHVHWSAIFWLNLPLGLLALALSNRLLRRLPRHGAPRGLDIAGAALMAVATILLMLALNADGRTRVAVLAAGSLLLWALFILRMRQAPEPLVPLRVFASPVLRPAMLSAALGYGTLIALTVYAPLYLQDVRRLSATQAGTTLIAMMIGYVVGTAISGRVIPHVADYKRLPLAGLALATLAMAAIAALDRRLDLATFVALAAFSCAALATLFPVAMVIVQNAAEPRDLGIAIAGMGFCRQLGAAILVAVCGALLFGRSAVASAALDFRPVFALAAICFAASLVAFAAIPSTPLRSAVPGALGDR
jgi:MFS family permease